MIVEKELSIKAMTISQVYSLYSSGSLVVNRKYQRKLCWTIEEKRNFLDTIIKGLPVPMFLFAANESGQYEIIDGMQRLDAICTYIGQKYMLKDGHYNLESMPDTIDEKRKGITTQKTPIMDSSTCKAIANYPLPVSIFPATKDSEVEEIFKRINSTGKHLSFQELRQVGVGTQFATIVRQLASEIRGDISKEVLLLKDMSNISLSNRRLPYSICTEDIFWVQNGIINVGEIRQSRDEEAIAYIISNMILPETERKPLSFQSLNRLYGYSQNPLNNTVPIEMTQINNAIDRIGFDAVKNQFRAVMSRIMNMLTTHNKTFRVIVKGSSTTSDLIIPFQIIFMAIHRLIIKENMGTIDYSRLARSLERNSSAIVHNVVKDNESRENAINAIYGLIKDAFTKSEEEDPALDDWTLEFVNILNKSKTEQTLYDFKIGFVPLYRTEIDKSVIDQVIKTLTAINNAGPNRTGYVIIGVADNEATANKYGSYYNFEPKLINGIPLCGIDHDANAISQNIDRYTHTIKEHIRKSPNIPEQYRFHLLSHMKTPLIYGFHTIVFKTAFTEPVPFDSNYYLRQFSDVDPLPKEQIPQMFNNYYKL